MAGLALHGGRHTIQDSDGSAFEADFRMLSGELGTGFSGAVREALCRRTGQKVAVKVYDKLAMQARELKNLTSEIDVHQRIAHPGIVKLEAVYESEEKVTIVMERLFGGELFERVVEQRRCAEADSAQVAVQLLEALIYLHDRSIVHRDIKLENIMYAEKGGSQVRLIDFGFATACEPETKLTQRCGTIQYAAPEVISGGHYDCKADMWSLGSVLFTMLTGRPLFRGDDQAVVKKAKGGLVDYNRYFRPLSAACRHFVERLLTVDPEDRLSARAALAHPWLSQARKDLAERATSAGTLAAGHGGSQRKYLKDAALKVLALGVLALCWQAARGLRMRRR